MLGKPAVQTPHRPKRFHLPAKDREYFSSNLALLLKAGVPVSDALTSLQETGRTRAFKAATAQMIQDVEEGLPLWKAMERSGVVSAQTLALVELGEQSGKLVDNMRLAARQEEKQRIFRAKVRSALLYPTFVLSLTAIVGLGVAWFLLPRLAETFGQLNVKLPFISKILINFGIFLKHDGFWAVPLGVALALLSIYLLFIAPKTRSIGLRLLFFIPGISGLMYETEVARFGYLLGTLLDAGLTVIEALGLLARATAAPQYQKFYQYLRTSFEDGYSFRTSLVKYKPAAKLLPPSVQQMIIAGERSGALPETLLNIGTIYEDKADISTQNLEVILEPILLVIVWLGVLAVAVAVILPIYSLVGNLQT
jgi:type IV pilus assembly protein PilC